MGQENVAGDPFQLGTAAQLEDLFRHLERAIALQIRTHVPAAVKAYNPATNSAVLTVQIQEVVTVPELTKLPTKIAGPPRGIPPNAEVTLLPIELVNIPVAWPATAGGRITFPLTVGDTGLLHVNDRSVEQWLLAGLPTEPVLTFTHALKDSVFYPGYAPLTKPIVPPPSTTATVIEGTPNIHLGPLAVESVTKAESLITELVAAITAAATGTNDGGALFRTNLITSFGNILPTVIGSVKAKVE
jgi:hypothetical protein